MDPFPNEILIQGVAIQRLSNVKLLGIKIDGKLSFDEHIRTICLKASRQLNALIRIQNHLNIKQRNTIYETFVLANFNFCLIVWNYCSSKNIIKLERIQKRALRFFTQ